MTVLNGWNYGFTGKISISPRGMTQGLKRQRPCSRACAVSLYRKNLPRTQDIHAILQALFQAGLDGQEVPAAAIDAAALDILGAEHEE
jgi:hypothetical protein